MIQSKFLFDEETGQKANALIDYESGYGIWINVSKDDPSDDLNCDARVKVELYDGQLRVLVFEKGNEDPLSCYERQL